MTRATKSSATRPKRKSRPLAFPVEFRLRIVKLFLEEGYSAKLLVEQFGISTHSIQRWVRAFRLKGAEELEPKRPVTGRSRVADEVRQQAVGVKQEHPEYGPRRIADVLKRFFLMRTSPATVHKTLSAGGLVKKAPAKAKKNPSKPRFFERARPNQLWQSDIMTFRLGGHNAYLIGFIDDYSRYITSLGLYRSQTAEHVLETYRRGVAEYGVPKEVLTPPTSAGPAVHQLAREDPLRAAARQGPYSPHSLPAASPDDAGQDRTVLKVDPGRVLAAGAV
jgi:transposase